MLAECHIFWQHRSYHAAQTNTSWVRRWGCHRQINSLTLLLLMATILKGNEGQLMSFSKVGEHLSAPQTFWEMCLMISQCLLDCMHLSFQIFRLPFTCLGMTSHKVTSMATVSPVCYWGGSVHSILIRIAEHPSLKKKNSVLLNEGERGGRT